MILLPWVPGFTLALYDHTDTAVAPAPGGAEVLNGMRKRSMREKDWLRPSGPKHQAFHLSAQGDLVVTGIWGTEVLRQPSGIWPEQASSPVDCLS
ncbi:hypothetical protein NQZ68_018965 [Dissostichus eleginoides]|nr:hypothetical protein NQZ68_018965 [Dissostichus eleginoides]